MKKLLACALLFIVALSSTGCTLALWDDVELSKRTIVTYDKVTDDQVVAFAIAERDMGSIYKNSLIMMGEQYWYVLPTSMNESKIKKLLKILRADLPKQFTLYPRDYDSAIKTAGKGRIPIAVDKRNYFRLSLCLNYEAQTAAEKATLKSLDFTSDTSCFLGMIGQVYSAKSIPAEYQFKTSIPVSVLKVVSSKQTVDPAATAKAVILTPFTVPLDILGGIFFLGGTATGVVNFNPIR